MKVKELIQVLKKLDPELKVVLSKDAEGNRFSLLYKQKIEVGQYVPIHSWRGDFTATEYNPDAVCLYPEN